MSGTYLWLVEPLIRAWPAPAQSLVRHLGYAAPFLECAIGGGLLTRRFRHAALFFAITMHVLILITLGPLGLNHNVVVWPWNLTMIAFLLILFRRTEWPAPRSIIWARGFVFQNVVLVLFALMPILSFFNLWDDEFSSALYSGNKTSGVIYLSDDVFNRLPSEIGEYVTEEGPNRNRLDINDWSTRDENLQECGPADLWIRLGGLRSRARRSEQTGVSKRQSTEHL